jgi:hypothetical protein
MFLAKPVLKAILKRLPYGDCLLSNGVTPRPKDTYTSFDAGFVSVVRPHRAAVNTSPAAVSGLSAGLSLREPLSGQDFRHGLRKRLASVS